jgi:uncharacterized protein (DUF39 family)
VLLQILVSPELKSKYGAKGDRQQALSVTQTNGCLVQVHYNRVAEDGISSHKEITVMFLPSLSDSIPILEVGQAQSREQQQAKLEHDIADNNEKVCTIKEASLFHDQLVEREVKSHNVVFVSQTCVVSFLCYKIHFSEWARSACIFWCMGKEEDDVQISA